MPASVPANMPTNTLSAVIDVPFSGLSQDEQLNQLTLAFAHCFYELNTLVMRAEDFHGPEPIYLPEADNQPAKIGYAHGFVRSLLHEVAHWTVAGKHRRTQIDYGYWYAPDGRSLNEQRAFEAAEVKPQAIEWLCCEALGIGFEPSLDNLHLINSSERAGDYDGGLSFTRALKDQRERYAGGHERLPARAARWIACLEALSLGSAILGVTA